MSNLFWITLVGSLAASAHVLAEDNLPDPTRPPAGLQTAGAASAPAVADVLVLQSVLLNAGRAPAAVISGQLVPLGGLVGELRLAQVTEHGVQLKGPQGTTTLRLMPDVHKQARAHRMEPTK
ncbi:MAG: MSHA biogenesis protein MshK [Cytophagales bacterium]|nr:MSHA biogenesis protein MshK [Rhizobacter sp.]